jgi:hypothetical protein
VPAQAARKSKRKRMESTLRAGEEFTAKLLPVGEAIEEQ